MFKEFFDELIQTSKPIGLGKFTFFNRYDSINVVDSFKVKSDERLRILEVKAFNEFAIHSSGRLMDRDVRSIHIVATFQINQDTGGFYLSPDTFVDKIMDLFLNQDVDFDNNKLFNNKYKVLANDADRVKDSLSDDFLDYASKLDYLELEVIGQRVVFCISRNPSTKLILKETINVGLALNVLLNK